MRKLVTVLMLGACLAAVGKCEFVAEADDDILMKNGAFNSGELMVLMANIESMSTLSVYQFSHSIYSPCCDGMEKFSGSRKEVFGS